LKTDSAVKLFLIQDVITSPTGGWGP